MKYRIQLNEVNCRENFESVKTWAVLFKVEVVCSLMLKLFDINLDLCFWAGALQKEISQSLM